MPIAPAAADIIKHKYDDETRRGGGRDLTCWMTVNISAVFVL